MVAEGMVRKGTSIRQVARQLGATEGALRYRLRKRAAGATVNGRSLQVSGQGYEEAIQVILERLDDGRLSGEGRPAQNRSRLETLATCAYVRARENALFLGPPGVGKSHLAVALGVNAIKNGFSTQHHMLDDLMHMLRADAAIPPARLKAKR